MKFFTACEADIKNGKTTDIYFVRTKEILEKFGIDETVVAEFTADTFPGGYEWAVFCGLEEVINLFEGKDVDVYAIEEGTIFRNKDDMRIRCPVILVEGEYKEFCELETPALGFICQSSGVATKAARIKKLAGEKIVLSFGIRRMHPAIAPMIDRSAYIGGCDEVSSIIGAEVIGKKPVGTMPHSLIIMFGDQERAWKGFDEVIDKGVGRVALIDTYLDEKAEAIKACKAIGNLYGVRLDTPSSRKGKMEDIVGEVKWELSIRGFNGIRIIVSGGVDETEIIKLRDLVDSFGVGTCISNAPTINYAMDVVEKSGKPVAKRGKLGGKKQWFRCEECFKVKVLPFGSEAPICCGKPMNPMLKKVIDKGKRVVERRNEEEIRGYVLKQLEKEKMEG